nr:MAGUK p55 subfamily member 3 isoform X3 [Macaca fascicularis]
MELQYPPPPPSPRICRERSGRDNTSMPVLSEDSGLHETLALLTSQLRPDSNHKEEMGFLRDVFSEKSLSYLMKIHEKLRYYERQSPTPVLHSAVALAEDVMEELQAASVHSDEKELLQLLSTPHLRAVLMVHDTVAQKNFDPVLPPLPDNIDEDFDEESVKIVRLVKNKEPLGATIRRDEHSGAVVVARIMRGGAADRSGLVHVGDELREVNGIAVLHKRPDEISQILAQSQGSITLKIIPATQEEDRLKESKVFMRALFHYNPREDRAIPCQEAGLPFQRRQVLEVVSQDDPTWWQAKRVGDTNLRAGLIPSKRFQERRLSYRRAAGTLPSPQSLKKPPYDQPCDKEACDCEGYLKGQYVAGLRRSFRLGCRERLGGSQEGKMSSGAESPELLTYEEVARYQHQPGERPRLVVLIGSLGARLHELKQKVVAENPQHFGVAVPRKRAHVGIPPGPERAMRRKEWNITLCLSKHLRPTYITTSSWNMVNIRKISMEPAWRPFRLLWPKTKFVWWMWSRNECDFRAPLSSMSK